MRCKAERRSARVAAAQDPTLLSRGRVAGDFAAENSVVRSPTERHAASSVVAAASLFFVCSDCSHSSLPPDANPSVDSRSENVDSISSRKL